MLRVQGDDWHYSLAVDQIGLGKSAQVYSGKNLNKIIVNDNIATFRQITKTCDSC